MELAKRKNKKVKHTRVTLPKVFGIHDEERRIRGPKQVHPPNVRADRVTVQGPGTGPVTIGTHVPIIKQKKKK